MSKMKHTLCYMAALVGFAACTQDELTGDTGKDLYPLTLTATVAGGADTRATVEGTWDGSEEIALKVDGDDDTYTYTVEDTNGNMSGDYYWKSTDDITVQGFYPFEAATATEWKVETQQDIKENYQGSDLLVSQKEQITWEGKDNASLSFYHQTAKVVVNVTNNGYLSGGTNDNVSMTINDLSTSASFTSPTTQTGTIWAGTWSNHSNQKDITPHKAKTTSGYAATFEALVIPQTISEGQTLFSFMVDGQTYTYTVPTGGITWETGKEYTYNMTLTMNGTVTVDITTGLPDWGTADKEETIQ